MRSYKLVISIFLLLLLTGCTTTAISVSPETIKINSSNENTLDVYIQDQHTEIIDLKLSILVNNVTLLNPTVINSNKINISSVSIPTNLQAICLKDINGTAFYQAEILTVISLGGNDYILIMDSPVDFNFNILDFGCLISIDLAVDGSITPIIFSISPVNLADDVEWDITRIIMACGGEGIGPTKEAPDDSDFMVGTNLINGIVLRSVNGIYKNIFNAKTNGELRTRTSDVNYQDKSKNGLYSTSFRRTFAGQDKNGVTIRLSAEDKDQLQIIIQDDLTNNFRCQAIVQGHVVD